jgi:hypothetical protein
LSDDFSQGIGGWLDWHESPGWVRGDGEALILRPREADHDAPLSLGDETYTFGALAVACPELVRGRCATPDPAWGSVVIEATMEVREQIRPPGAGNLPAAWEVGWLLFRFRDERAYYYVLWKTHHARAPEEDYGGVELGKYHCSDCGLFEVDPGKETLMQRTAAEMPAALGGWLELGRVHRLRVEVRDLVRPLEGNAVEISLSIDDVPVLSLIDDGTLTPIWGGDGPTPPLFSGGVGLYAEDSEVRWDDVTVTAIR